MRSSGCCRPAVHHEHDLPVSATVSATLEFWSPSTRHIGLAFSRRRQLAAGQRDHTCFDVPGHLRLHRRSLMPLACDHLLHPSQCVVNAMATRYTVDSEIANRSAINRQSGDGPTSRPEPAGPAPGRSSAADAHQTPPPSTKPHGRHRSTLKCTASEVALRLTLVEKHQPDQPIAHTLQIGVDASLVGRLI